MPDTLTESTRFDVNLPGVRFARVAVNAVADPAQSLLDIYLRVSQVKSSEMHAERWI